MDEVKLSVSIVVYRERFFDIKACLSSLIDSIPEEVSYEITIIDNGVCELNNHSDIPVNCAHYFPNLPIRYQIAPRNGGYGYGHNQVIFASQADYHLIINSDVYIEVDALKNALLFLENNPEVGMVVPDVYDMTENRVYLCRHNPRLWISFLRRFSPSWLKKRFTKQLAEFEMRDRDYESPMLITNPTGCFMFCRLSVLKAVNGFDEKLFMYYEDADLGRRLSKISRIAYVPSVKIKHGWQRASYHDRRMAWIAIKSALYYAWKWYGADNRFSH